MTEIILIFLVVLLLFGARRLPEIGSSLGKGIREFKGSLREIESELKMDDTDTRPRQVQRPPVGDEVESTPRRLTSNDVEAEPPTSPAAPRQESATGDEENG